MKLIATAILASAAIAGCSSREPAPKPIGGGALKTGSKSAEFKVALLTPGPVSDAGWSAMAYDGLQSIKQEMGATVNNREAKGTQIRDALRTYAQQGYQLVFGHGYEYNEPSMEVAKDFPGTVFVSSSGGMTARNVGAFRFYLEQGFYLCGILAGSMSKTGIVGMIGGDDVPSIRSTFRGFRAGVLSVNPSARVIEVFTGSGQDIAAARRATLKAIDEGADFVIHQANAAAQGVFDACKERGAWCFGANLDQNDNPSGRVLASAVIVAGPAFLELAQMVKDNRFVGSVSLMGMDKGAIDFRFNHDLLSHVPDAIVKRVEDARVAISSGKLSVPRDEF